MDKIKRLKGRMDDLAERLHYSELLPLLFGVAFVAGYLRLGIQFLASQGFLH